MATIGYNCGVLSLVWEDVEGGGLKARFRWMRRRRRQGVSRWQTGTTGVLRSVMKTEEPRYRRRRVWDGVEPQAKSWSSLPDGCCRYCMNRRDGKKKKNSSKFEKRDTLWVASTWTRWAGGIGKRTTEKATLQNGGFPLNSQEVPENWSAPWSVALILRRHSTTSGHLWPRNLCEIRVFVTALCCKMRRYFYNNTYCLTLFTNWITSCHHPSLKTSLLAEESSYKTLVTQPPLASSPEAVCPPLYTRSPNTPRSPIANAFHSLFAATSGDPE
ncbi:hypothetical protein QBC44DRAFT_53943 [Cladorrhinum sp. PSN332]|nr:hypothetical protein QBC44DRAFT_53943 [Cladorrhinum sp. PSN332]